MTFKELLDKYQFEEIVPEIRDVWKHNDISGFKMAFDCLKGKEKCDVVICLSHLGWDLKPDMDDSTMIAASRDIDLVLGGHSHSYFTDLEWVRDAAGHNVPVDQNGKHGIFIGRITMSIESKK